VVCAEALNNIAASEPTGHVSSTTTAVYDRDRRFADHLPGCGCVGLREVLATIKHRLPSAVSRRAIYDACTA